MPSLNFFKKISSQGGFTIVELIVAVLILSILTTMGIVIFSNASKNSRDESRFRDLNSYKQALSLYYQQNRYYPSSAPDLVPKYLSALKNDPNGQSYIYQAQPASCTTALRNCTSYTFCAKKDGNKEFNIPNPCRNLVCTNGQNDCMGVSSDD